MKARRLAALAFSTLVLPAGFARAQADANPPTLGKIERLDPKLDAIVPPGARIERVAEGFDWSEGTVWDAAGSRLLFSDTMHNVVIQYQKGKGTSQFLKPSGYTGPTARGGEPGSNGLTFDHHGKLVLCQHGDRRIARLESDGKFSTIVDRFEGKRLNSPNDGVFKSNGDYYFTDPPYGLVKLNDDPAKEIPFSGVYRVKPDGSITLLTKELGFPNGIAFSPDEKTMYVAQSDPAAAILKAFPVKQDGTLGKGKVLFDATKWVKDRPGLPDGMTIDAQGHIWASGPGGIYCLTPEGKVLGRISTGERTSNCKFGDDGSTLYLTADSYICRVKTNVKGLGF
jgi:gluconolactonase